MRAAGVSNFTPAQLERLRAETGELPEVNQIQLRPTAVRAAPVAYHAQNGIVTQSWSPLGRADARLLGAAPVVEAARRHDRTPGQIVLRWHVQQGLSAVPKSSDPHRLAQNLALFDFTLSEEEMAALGELDRGDADVVDPHSFGH